MRRRRLRERAGVGRHPRGAAWLLTVLLAAFAPPAAAQDTPTPLVWTRVDAPPVVDAPAVAPALPVAPPEPTDRAPRPIARDTRYDALIDTVARQCGLDAGLLHAVIATESRYDADARSPKGAVGLMQVMPATGRRFGFVDLADPDTNVRAGATYLKWLLKTFDNNLELAVAGYNAGEGAVMKSGWRIPPYRETRQYVSAVLGRYRPRGDAGAPLAVHTATAAIRHRPATAAAAHARPSPATMLGRLAGLLLSSPHASISPDR